MDAEATAGLLALATEECWRLLRNHPTSIGRIGLAVPDGAPLVLPMNYRVDDETVVVRTGKGSTLAQRAGGLPVAFEVDDVDAAWQEGWSVLVQGTASAVTDGSEHERLSRLPLRPWAHGEHPVYVRITPTVVTGRRIH